MSYLEKRTEFLMPCAWRGVFQKLDNEKAGELIKAIFALNNDQEDTDFHEDPMLDMLWDAMIKPYIIAKMEKYEEKCRNLAVNGGKGGNATANNRKDKSDNSDEDGKSQQMLANANDKTRLDKTRIDNDKTDKTERQAAGGQSSFPTLELIKQYCVENGLSVDAEEYYNKMESQEWKYKGEPIKDWKRHIKSWSKKDPPKPPEEKTVLSNQSETSDTEDSFDTENGFDFIGAAFYLMDNNRYWCALDYTNGDFLKWEEYNRCYGNLNEDDKREFYSLDCQARSCSCMSKIGNTFEEFDKIKMMEWEDRDPEDKWIPKDNRFSDESHWKMTEEEYENRLKIELEEVKEEKLLERAASRMELEKSKGLL